MLIEWDGQNNYLDNNGFKFSLWSVLENFCVWINAIFIKNKNNNFLKIIFNLTSISPQHPGFLSTGNTSDQHLYPHPTHNDYHLREHHEQQPDSTSYTLGQTSNFYINVDTPDFVTTTSSSPFTVVGQNSNGTSLGNSSVNFQQKRGCLQLWQFLITLLNDEPSSW